MTKQKTVADVVAIQAEHTTRLGGLLELLKGMVRTQDEHTMLLNEHTVLLKLILAKLDNKERQP